MSEFRVTLEVGDTPLDDRILRLEGEGALMVMTDVALRRSYAEAWEEGASFALDNPGRAVEDYRQVNPYG